LHNESKFRVKRLDDISVMTTSTKPVAIVTRRRGMTIKIDAEPLL
jgi:hypothetical protein